ncbi:DUF2179 domain-containing protein [Geoalkalibacter sp.]|jgi:uncharacterized protein YebE (UPF0316 family)|uniref:DUF2179 domain-containing protein n=1 Tax=Geoalkalibacter sp. TaxID=3041440 RepID=UPI00272E9877|nr:DUF2179 domain-containing protein [Geoalkalibacter sp.]
MFSLFADNSSLVVTVAVPLLVFLARVIDVSLATLRISMVYRGLKHLAAPLGFLEALIWVLAISQVMQHLDNWFTYLAFALGFGAGNYVGLLIEERLAFGNLILRVITPNEDTTLSRALWDAGFGVTNVSARGESGPVKVIFTVVKRRDLHKALGLIRQSNPNAFYTIEDVRFFTETYPPAARATRGRKIFQFPLLKAGKQVKEDS